MPVKEKKETIKKEKKAPKETPKVERPTEGVGVEPTKIESVNNLDLKFEKVNLIDRNDIYVGMTAETFSLDGKEYSGKEYFLVMFGNAAMYAVAKAFFNKIAQILPT